MSASHPGVCVSGGVREITTVTFYFQNMSLSPFTSLQLRNYLESEKYKGTKKKGSPCIPPPLPKS